MKNTKSNEKQFFYGWIIVVACMLIQAVPYTIITNIQPAFTSYVVEGEGFKFAQFSLIFTIGTVVSAVCAPFIGKFYSNPKLNIKMFYTVGALLAGCGFTAFSIAGDNIYAYYGFSILAQIGCCIISAIGVPTLVNIWFTENKGIAMGLAFSGSGLGNMIFQQFAGSWLQNPAIGYSGAYLRFGIICTVVGLAVALFLVRLPKSPSELASNTSKKNKSNSKPSINWGYTLAEVTKMKYFWILAGSFIFIGLYVGGMAIQFLPYLQGLEKTGQLALNASIVASVFGLCSIFGNLFGGVFFDKLGIAKSLILACVLIVLCGLSLIFTPQINVLAFVFAVALGISMFSYIIGPSYLTSSLFGNKEFGTILGIIQIFFAIGFGSGSAIFGLVIDKFGFTIGWITTIVYAIIAYTGLLLSTNAIAKINRDNNVIETKKIA